MCDLDVDGGPFDVVTCLFDSIGYAQDDDRIVSALRSLRRHAAPGGHVVCEFLHAPAIVQGGASVRVKQLVLRDGRDLVRISETTVDLERMLMQVAYELWAVDGDGRAEHGEELQTNRLFSAPEMRMLAAAAGLSVHDVVPAYTDGPIGPNTFHLLLVAEPAS